MDQDAVEKMEAEFCLWEWFLNNTVGVLAFTLALACLGTNSPSVNALLSLLFLSAIYYLGRANFPRLYSDLRNKKQKSTYEKVLFAGATSHFLGFKAMLSRYTAFALGYAFLVFVLFGNGLSERFPGLAHYFYGS